MPGANGPSAIGNTPCSMVWLMVGWSQALASAQRTRWSVSGELVPSGSTWVTWSSV